MERKLRVETAPPPMRSCPFPVRFLLKHWRRILWIGTALAIIAPLGIAWWAGGEIASPPRRALMDYHREHLDHAAAHGMRIDRFTAGDGTPCLVASPSGQAAARGAKIRAELTARGMSLSEFGRIRGALVLVHGRKGRKEDYLPVAERFCAAGFRCVIPDLPAHGEHPVTVATYGVREAALPARVLAEAARKFGFPPQPAGLVGLSMGGSVAMHAAAEPDAPWSALAVIATFDSLATVIQGQAEQRFGRLCGPPLGEASARVYEMRTGLPLSQIQPVAKAEQAGVPTLVAHGTADPVAPIAAGRRLFDAIPDSQPKKWVEIPDAGHDDVLITAYPIYAEIAAWMLDHLPAASR